MKILYACLFTLLSISPTLANVVTITSFSWGPPIPGPVYSRAPTISFSSLPMVLPQPNFNAARYYGPVLMIGSLTSTGTINTNFPYVAVNASDTWESASQKFIDKYGASASYTSSGLVYGTAQYAQIYFCMGMMDGLSIDGHRQALQPNSCTRGSLSPVVCNIDDMSQIAFGPLSIDEVNGKKKSTTATLSCDQNATVSVRNITPSVDLGHGVTANNTINGLTTPPAFLVNGPRTITIESTLSAPNPSAGDIGGNAIFILEIQ